MGGKQSRRLVEIGDEDYKRHGCIGTGGFSQVFVVEHRNTKQLRAIARIKKAKLLSEKKWGLEGTLQSLEAAKVLRGQPYLMPVYVSFQDDHFLYLLMKLCDGGELRNEMVTEDNFRIRVGDEVLRRCLAELIIGIESMHARGVVHRDLKPENILIDSAGRIVIADYGLAVLTKKDSWLYVPNENKMVVGTLAFIAPELLHRWPHTEKVDWWSLGIIAYKMSMALFPWDTPLRSDCRDFVDACDKFIRIQNSNPIRFEPDTNPELIDLLKHLLDKNPQTRYGPREIKKHPFFRGLDWKAVREMKDIPPFEPSVNYGKLLEGKVFVDDEDEDDLNVLPEEQLFFEDWDWMDEDGNMQFENAVNAIAVQDEIDEFMQSPAFDIKATRVYPDRQRQGRPKTIFNLLDIPVKLPVWTEAGTYLKRVGIREVRVGMHTKTADLFSVAGAGFRTMGGSKSGKTSPRTEVESPRPKTGLDEKVDIRLEDAEMEDIENKYAQQPSHVKEVKLKKRFGTVPTSAIAHSDTPSIKLPSASGSEAEVAPLGPAKSTYRLQKFFGDKNVDPEMAKLLASIPEPKPYDSNGAFDRTPASTSTPVDAADPSLISTTPTSSAATSTTTSSKAPQRLQKFFGDKNVDPEMAKLLASIPEPKPYDSNIAAERSPVPNPIPIPDPTPTATLAPAPAPNPRASQRLQKFFGDKNVDPEMAKLLASIPEPKPYEGGKSAVGGGKSGGARGDVHPENKNENKEEGKTKEEVKDKLKEDHKETKAKGRRERETERAAAKEIHHKEKEVLKEKERELQKEKDLVKEKEHKEKDLLKEKEREKDQKEKELQKAKEASPVITPRISPVLERPPEESFLIEMPWQSEENLGRRLRTLHNDESIFNFLGTSALRVDGEFGVCDEQTIHVLDRWRIKDEEILEDGINTIRAELAKQLELMRLQVLDEIKLLTFALGNVNEFKEDDFVTVEDHQSELDSMKRRHELGLPIVDKRYLSEKSNEFSTQAVSATSNVGSSLSKSNSSDSIKSPRSDASKTPRGSGKFDSTGKPIPNKEVDFKGSKDKETKVDFKSSKDKETKTDFKGSNDKKPLSGGESPEKDRRRLSSDKGKDKKRLSGDARDKNKKRLSSDKDDRKAERDTIFGKSIQLDLEKLESTNVVSLERYRTDESDDLPPPFTIDIPDSLQDLLREASRHFGIQVIKVRNEKFEEIRSLFDIVPRSHLFAMAIEDEQVYLGSVYAKSPVMERSSALHNPLLSSRGKGPNDTITASGSLSAMRLTKEALWSAWDANAMAVIVLSPLGEVVYSNKEALSFFNLPRTKLIGSPLNRFLTREYQSADPKQIAQLLSRSSLALENATKVSVRGSILPQVDGTGGSWFVWVQSEAV